MQLLFLALGLALFPVYGFESGTIQYSHACLALFSLFFLANRKLTLTTFDMLPIMLAIVMFAREAVALLYDPTPMSLIAGTSPARRAVPILASAYMAFNAVIVIALSRIPLNDGRFLKIVRMAIASSLAIAIGGVFYYGVRITVGPDGLTRAVGTFNNSDQLGYFAICSASLGALLYLRGAISRILYVIFLVSALILVAASASRSAFFACGPLIIIGFASLINKKRVGPFAIGAALMVATAVWVLYVSGALDQLGVVQRLQNTGSGRFDTLASRGYRFLLDNPRELIFGLGLKQTMMRTIGWHEVHSTFWSFMITYGLLAFALFIYFWILWAKSIYRESGLLGVALVVVPASVYGIGNNGSRFTIFWVLIALSLNKTFGLRSAGFPFGPAPARGPGRPIPGGLAGAAT